MSGAITSLIAVAGTLLGSLATHIFQRRTTDRAEQLTRQRIFQEQRLAAFSAFAGALVDFRRGQYDRWHRRNEEPDSPAAAEARTESYRLRSTAYQALFRVQMVTHDQDLVRLAEVALEATNVVHDAASEQEVREFGDRARQAVNKFVVRAGEHVRGELRSPIRSAPQ